MRLHVAHTRLSCRQPNCSIPLGLIPGLPLRALQSPLQRDVTVRTTKATTLSWDDLADAVPRANPEKRVLQDINFYDLVKECADWPALQRLETDLRDRYERSPSLAVSVLVRASELVDVEGADAGAVRGVRRMLAGSIAPFLAQQGVLRLQVRVLPSVLAALAALQYSNPTLNDVLLKMFESGVGGMMAGPLCASVACFAQLGVRLPPPLLEAVAQRLGFSMRHCSAADVGNLAAALAPYKQLPECFRGAWLVKLSSHSLPLLGEVPGEQLVDLLGLFVKQDFPLTPTWVGAYQKALLAALPGLMRPRAYAALLFCLAKGSLAITEDFLAALLARLAAPGPRLPSSSSAPSPSSSSAAAPGRPAGRSPSLLARMRPTELGVVAAVLSIYGYAPQPGWGAKYVEAVRARAAEFEAKQVVTVVDTCVELGIPLGADLMDELLAVAEAGLGGLPPGRLMALAAALAGAGHEPDAPWLRQMHAALLGAAGRCSGAELAEVVAVLMNLPSAYPVDADSTAAVLAAVKARATALGGLAEATRVSVREALEQLRHPDAAAFANGLKPPPPAPSPPPPPPPAAAVAAPPAPPPPPVAKASGRAASSAAAGTPGMPAAAPAAPAPAAAAAATAASSRARAAAASAPPPPPPPPQAAAASGQGRTAAYDDDDEFDEDEYEEEDEEFEAPPPPPPVAKRAAAPPPAAAAPPRAAQAPPPPPPAKTAPPPPPPPAKAAAPPPPPAPAAVEEEEGFVASTRTRRRR